MVDTVEIQDPMTLGELKEDLKEMFDRGGDSSLDDRLAGRLLNAAEVFIVNFIGAPKCLEHTDTIVTTASDKDLTFPVNVEDITNIWDDDNIRQLDFIEKRDWSAFITRPEYSSGSPYAWTKWGFVRRTNQESPSEPFGALQVQIWPVPTTAYTLNYDCILRPGYMNNDSDFPVLPIDYHWGILQVALMNAGQYDIGVGEQKRHERMAMMWLNEMRRKERRDLAGDLRFIGRDEFSRRQRRRGVPLTRRAQLYGGLW